MKILHFSTSSEDTAGGAAKAAYRLHTALQGQGHDSRMLVRYKNAQNKDVYQVAPAIVPRWKRLVRKLQHRFHISQPPIPKYVFNFDIEQDIDLQSALIAQKTADIVCLHWITGFLTVQDIERIYNYFKCPIVLNLMDQEPLTGGCHYSFGCEGYTKECGNCPQLTPSHANDLSHTIWLEKQRTFEHLPITLIAANSWASERINKSSLFGKNRVEHIGVPVDTSVFRPIDRTIARDLLNIPQNKKIVFFGASLLEDPRKGMSYLVDSLQCLASLMDNNEALQKEDIFLLVAGSQSEIILSSLPFSYKFVGTLKDDITLALAYQASDVFVCPSVEDGGPMMISESLLCGTPVVAFNSGIAPDLIETMKNGYVATYKDSKDLAQGIKAVLLDTNADKMSEYSCEAAKKLHDPMIVAKQFENLFHSLVVVQQR